MARVVGGRVTIADLEIKFRRIRSEVKDLKGAEMLLSQP